MALESTVFSQPIVAKLDLDRENFQFTRVTFRWITFTFIHTTYYLSLILWKGQRNENSFDALMYCAVSYNLPTYVVNGNETMRS